VYPRLLQLTQLARRYDIGLNIDAEEADRLEISLTCWSGCAMSRNWPAGTVSASSCRPT
jgi:proline dehydrogenase